MVDCNARFGVGIRVFEQLWSSGDVMWLCPTLILVIAGHSVVLSWCAYGFSHRRVGVGYALRVSPVVTRLKVYRRPQVDVKITVRWNGNTLPYAKRRCRTYTCAHLSL